MEGLIVSFRRGIRTQQKYQMIVKVDSSNSREEARELINKKVIWKSIAGNEINGVISNVHGNKGALRVQFEKGLPGQSLGTKVKIE